MMWWAAVVFIFIWLVNIYSVTHGHSVNKQIPDISDPSVIKTVAHVDLSDKPQWECVYENIDDDVAYYKYTGEHTLAKTGDNVVLRDGMKAVITYRDINGFKISSEEVVFVSGMSGQVVQTESGDDVGVISELLPTNEVYCIWAW